MKYDRTASDLNRNAMAAKSLIATLQSDDADFCHDVTEGETGLFEAIDAALAEMDECDVRIEGCKAKEVQFSDRRKAAEKRKDRIRGLIEQALVMAEIPTVKRSTATLTVRDLPPSIVVTDESLIPAKYWKQPDPKLDLAGIKSDAKDGAEIPGTSLSNGTTSLTIRRL